MDFRKAFDIVPRARLMQRLEALGVPTDMQWGIYALYEYVLGKVWSSEGLSEAVASTIGVKQGCPLSPDLFGLYIDEVSHYIERFGGSGARLASITIQILLYADDIVLISDSPEELQRHLNALKLFCMDKGLSINMDKTKVMVFNPTQAWVTRHTQHILEPCCFSAVNTCIHLRHTFRKHLSTYLRRHTQHMLTSCSLCN